MTDIWGFLNQSLYVSTMALIILGLKQILKDKLSARWQYGVWSALVLCLFMPAGRFGGYMVPQLHIYLQALKSYVEAGLSSVYADATAIHNRHILPVITGRPQSVADILFCIYIIGIIRYLARYITGYVRLKLIISASSDAAPDTVALVSNTAEKYGLTGCKVKAVRGIASAFVFGILNPVLVLPADIQTDEKVILHELLHLKHKDLWQNVFWSVAKAFHWPNPLLQYVFKTIHNDMETVCDFRVMELLEGEDRREYGRILLSMTNDKYPSAFGTTSISNGGHFIAERIKAIARFKKYPQGMGVVAGCIVALLFPLAVKGTAYSYFDNTQYHNKNSFDYQLAVARAQLVQCTTPAGAIDTFAKAFITDNEVYAIAVTPAEKNEKYKLPEMPYYNMYETDVMYYILNLQQTESGSYTAQLMFKEFFYGDEYGTNYYIVPVEITEEKGWKVRQTADYACYTENVIDHAFGPPTDEKYIGLADVSYETDYGKLDITGVTFSFTSDTSYNTLPVPDLEIGTTRTVFRAEFSLNERCCGFGSAATAIGKLNDMDFTYDYYEEASQDILGNQHISMSSSVGYSMSNTVFGESFDGVLHDSLIYEHDRGEPMPVGLQFDLWLGTDHYRTLKINLQTGAVYEQNI